MKERMTQLFPALLGILLVAQLFRPSSVVPTTQGQEAVPPTSTIRARLIELVDERGQVRANLKVEPDGEAVFRIRDAKGAIRVKLGASTDGSALLLLDDRTEPAVHLLAKPTGTAVTLAEKGKDKRVIRP